MLKLVNVSKDYPTKADTVHALKGVTLAFREHEFVAILGPSGCGKTTMLNIIGGLDRYTDGDLIIGGVSTASFDDKHWDAYRNATIGFVFQSYNLIPHLTVMENVELALSLAGVKKKERQKRVREALERVGMAEFEKMRPNQLSGGQMQRVAIARAIVNNPKIILADEPTGALDSELSEQVMQILKEISEHTLVIMVTHNAELAQTYTSRICRFKDGRLVEDTNPYLFEASVDGAVQNTEAENDQNATSIDQNDGLSADIANTTEIVAAVSEGDEGGAPAAETPKKKAKKKSNRLRKKEMKNISSEANEVFERLGINSLDKQKKKKNKAFNPTSMSLGMAFGLSLRNLVSKRRRTFLTSFAGSIGIIGLGLVLAISNGFSVYVEKMQTEMLAGVPMGVYEYNVQVSAVTDMMSSFMNSGSGGGADMYPDGDSINVNGNGGSSGFDLGMIQQLISSFFSNVSKNDMTEEFADYMHEMPQSYYGAMNTFYGVRYNLIAQSFDDDGNKQYLDVSQQPNATSALTIAMNILGEQGLQPDYWQQLVGDEAFFQKSYEFVGEGHYPRSKNELLLCISPTNTVDEAMLDEFGIRLIELDGDGNPVIVDGKPVQLDKTALTSADFVGRKIRLVTNNVYYGDIVDDGQYKYYDIPGGDLMDGSDDDLGIVQVFDWAYTDQQELADIYNGEGYIDLEIVGVVRPKKDAATSYISGGLCYLPELAEYVMQQAYDSDVAKFQRELLASSNPDDEHKTIFYTDLYDTELTSGDSIAAGLKNTIRFTSYLKAIGAVKVPTFISFYPETFQQKVDIGDYINKWHSISGDNVGYFDVSEMFIYNLNLIIRLVSILLVAVASIALVVSTVMIGVITSNSVIERTREIGILRSLGARGRDIRHVFIAETSLIGLAGGLIGITITYILTPIISAIIGAISGVASLLHFHPLHALLLVVLSFVLTVVSGILPAIGASRKNVVDALRLE